MKKIRCGGEHSLFALVPEHSVFLYRIITQEHTVNRNFLFLFIIEWSGISAPRFQIPILYNVSGF
jgi:hypothetical protein